MANPAPTINQINAFNATQGTTIDFNIIGGTELVRSNRIYIYDLSDNSLICTHLYVSTESIHELPPNTDGSIVYEDGKSSADFVNGAQYYAQIQTFTDIAGTEGGSGLSVAKMFWCLVDPTLTITTIPSTISTTSYNISATYNANTSVVSNIIQQYQFSLYSATGSLLQSSGVVVGSGEQQGTSMTYDISYNFTGLSVGSSYYVVVDVTTTQGMSVTTQSGTFTVSIDTPTLGEATVVNNACDGYISVTSNLSSEYGGSGSGEIVSFETDSENVFTKLQVDLEPVQGGTPWVSPSETDAYLMRISPQLGHDYNTEFDTLVGGTVAWNQLYNKTGNASGNGITFTNVNGVITLSGVCTANQWYTLDTQSLPTNHKYLVTGGNSASTLQNAFLYVRTGNGLYTQFINGATAGIVSPCLNVSIQATNGYNADANPLKFTPQIFDLTQMFGSTVADAIYAMEQAQSGSGVSFFRKYFSKAYYPYDAGTLMSVKTSAHKTTGKNLLEMSVTPYSAQGVTISQNGKYVHVVANSATGYPFTKIGAIPSSFPSGVYWLPYSTTTAGIDFRIIDRTVTPAQQIPREPSGRVTIPSGHNGYTVEIAITGASLANGTYDVACALVAENITFEPYVEHTYPLDPNLELRGLFKLENSKLKADGDVYSSSGNVQRKYGVVDLGTLNYNNASATTGLVTATSYLPNQKYYNNNWDNQPRTINSKGYTQRPYYTGGNDDVNKVDHSIGFVGSANGAVAIRDIALAGMTGAQVKAALSGVYLIYPLATPTTETAMPFEANQSIIPNGSEEYVDSRTVPIPVGHLTSYADVYPITGHDEVDVVRTGKNLNPNEGVNYSTWTSERFFLKAGQYVLSTDNGEVVGQNNAIYIQLQDEAGNVITKGGITSSWFILNGSETFYYGGVNAPSRAFVLNFDAYMLIGFNNQKPTNFNALQLELGTTATDYEPYNGQSYHQDIEATYTPTVQENDVYLFKRTGDVGGDRETIELIGGTVAWNQLAKPSQTTTKYGITCTNNGDGTCTYNGTSTSRSQFFGATRQESVRTGDKILMMANNVTGSCTGGVCDLFFYLVKNDGSGNLYPSFILFDANGNYGRNSYIYNSSADGIIRGENLIVDFREGATATSLKFSTQLINLTQMFGSTIADYIYSLEQANAGAGVAFFKKLFPKAYYPYNAGELISVKTSAHKTIGFNQWDEEWEVGDIERITGQNNPTQNAIRSTGYIPVIPSTTYYAKCPSANQIRVLCYDADKAYIYIQPDGLLGDYSNSAFTVPNNCRFIRITTRSNYGATYHNDICINISDASKNGTYEPYVENTYPLDSDLELRGMLKLDASNNLYYDGDTYKHDGSVNRKYGTITYNGTEWWGVETQAGSPSFYRQNPADLMRSNDTLCNACPVDINTWGVGNLRITSGYMNFVLGTPLGISTVDEWKAWLASHPVTVVYPLATPTTETADAFEEIQKVTPIYGTEEFVDSRTVPMPVYTKTQYFTRDVYGGYIDLVSGLLTVTDVLQTITNKTTVYNSYPNRDNTAIIIGYAFSNIKKVPTSDDKGYVISDYARTATTNEIYISNDTLVTTTRNGYLQIMLKDITDLNDAKTYLSAHPLTVCYELATPQTYQLTPQQIQTLVGQNNVWSEQGEISLAYHIPITNLLVKRQDVADVSGSWLTLYSQPITQASDMDFTFIDFTNQYGKTYKYALVPLLTQIQSGVEVEVEGGYTVSDEVQSVFDGVFISDSTGSQKCKANVAYGNVDMNQTVGTITPIGAKYPVVITNSKNQYHNGSISGTIVPDDYYFNGNLSRIDMVNKRDELEQFLTNKRAKIIKDWNGKIWLVMIMDNVSCTFNNNYGMGIVNFSTNWVEVGDPTNQQDLQATGLIDIGGV